MSERRGFDRIIGQELAKRVLMRAVKSGEISHAYLFVGLQRTGKTTMAVELARALNCESPDDGNACGQCTICHAIDRGNFGDLRIWSPDGQNTKIDQMREMRDLARFAPIRGKWKINIIEQGDTLNEDSANCILKLVEEPPDYLINILLYRNAANVMATIRSRCQLIRFTQVSVQELARRLVEDFGIDKAQAEFLATYSQGRPGAAIELMGNNEFFERRDGIIRVADAASSGNPWLALRLAEALRPSKGDKKASESEDDSEDEDSGEAEIQPSSQPKKRASSREVTSESLDILLTWYRDLLAVKLQGSEARVVNADRTDDLREQAARYRHAAPLVQAVESVIKTKRGIIGNANPRIQTEALMLRLVSAVKLPPTS